MKPESKRTIRQVQQNFDHSIWSINDRKRLTEALKSFSVEEVKQNAKEIFENKSVLEIDCFIKKLHHSRESYSKIRNCNPEFKYIECINLWSQLMYDIIGDRAHDNSSLMIGKLMSLIGQNEVPKNPEKTNGVNYRVIYNYLANILMGLPPPSLEPLESAVVLELLDTMFFKLSVSDLEAQKNMLLWKCSALTANNAASNKHQIQKALENDFQSMDMSELSESAKKKILEPEERQGKQQRILHRLLTKPKTVAKKPQPKPTPKEEPGKKSTVIYEIQHVDELLPDGTKATVVKLNPIVVSLADPSMKPLWENNEPVIDGDSEENPNQTTSTELEEDGNVKNKEVVMSQEKSDTTLKSHPQKDITDPKNLPVVVSVSPNEPQENLVRSMVVNTNMLQEALTGTVIVSPVKPQENLLGGLVVSPINPQESLTGAVVVTPNRPQEDLLGTVCVNPDRPQEGSKRPIEEGAVSRKYLKMEDGSEEHCKDFVTISEPSKSLMFRPDTLWINPLCIPPHLTNIEFTEHNQ